MVSLSLIFTRQILGLSKTCLHLIVLFIRIEGSSEQVIPTHTRKKECLRVLKRNIIK